MYEASRNQSQNNANKTEKVTKNEKKMDDLEETFREMNKETAKSDNRKVQNSADEEPLLVQKIPQIDERINLLFIIFYNSFNYN